MPKIKKNICLFLDRDGVINFDFGYISKIEDFKFVEGIFDLTQFAQSNNLLIIVVTNQSGIGRGLFSEKDFLVVNEFMLEVFRSKGIKIDGVYYCPTHPTHGKGIYKTEDINRKPNPGMFLEAAKDHNIDLENSFLIGDRLSDLIAAHKAGLRNIYFLNQSPKDIPQDLSLKERKVVEAAKRFENLISIKEEIKNSVEDNSL